MDGSIVTAVNIGFAPAVPWPGVQACEFNMDCHGHKFCDNRTVTGSCVTCSEINREVSNLPKAMSWKDCGQCFEGSAEDDAFYCKEQSPWTIIWIVMASVAIVMGAVGVALIVRFCWKHRARYDFAARGTDHVAKFSVSRMTPGLGQCVLDLQRFLKICAANKHFIRMLSGI